MGPYVDSPANRSYPLSIDMVWVLVTGFLVMFMQAGFMFVETGLIRAKNAAHTAAMNFMIYRMSFRTSFSEACARTSLTAWPAV